MSLTAEPLHPHFAARVTGVDFSRPIDEATAHEIIRLNDQYAVLSFPDTGLGDEGHVAFSRLLGPLELAPATLFNDAKNPWRLKLPELFEAGNIDHEGKITGPGSRARMFGRGNQLWHTDSSFNQTRSSYSLLLAHVVPPVPADTEFADMRAAYDALSPAMKNRIEGLECEHDVWYSRQLAGFPEVTAEDRAKKPPAVHRLVQTHPGSGRKTLYLASHVSRILGWPLDEGRALIRELQEFATQPEFVYHYHWRQGDLVMWDNRCTMHRATPFEDTLYIRDMRRTTVLDAAFA